MLKDFNELILVKKEYVCQDIVSLYLESKDGSKLKKAKAGQFISIKVDSNDEKYQNVVRAYSLSNGPSDKVYRITIKKLEDGILSKYLYDDIKEGDTVFAKEPMGKFFIDENLNNDVSITLLSGGIGVTPVLSILYDEQGKKNNITFVQAVQNSNIHPFKEDISKICIENNYRNFVFYSNPLDNDKEGENYDVTGFVTKEWLEKNVDLTGKFYFCGPAIFMKILKENLLDLGVSKENIHFEYFG